MSDEAFQERLIWVVEKVVVWRFAGVEGWILSTLITIIITLWESVNVPSPGSHVRIGIAPNPAAIKTLAEALGHAPTEDDLYENDLYEDSTHLSLGHLKYEKGVNLIFDNGEYTIAAERTYSEIRNYSQYAY